MSGAFTTRRRVKAWSWSYSKLKNYETCPKRHWHLDIQRDVKEPEGPALKWGNEVHAALEARIAKGKPLPPSMQEYEPWAKRVLTGAGEILVEQKFAIKADFTACDWFDDQAWFRAKGDVVKINGAVALVVDWKTGKVLDESEQLALMAACVFAAYPKIQMIRSMFAWLKEDADTVEDFTREGMVDFWAHIWPRITKLKEAHDGTLYPPKPGGLCKKYCPVKQCPHNGGG